ncbi:MAG TPA: tetratricopeptide repeat protein, partial [Burkholderiaceae bacterium]|nr:tetratricopeptide repeat protein [Burkholderiaceae bacterium]
TPQLKDAWSPRLARENIDHRIAATAQAQARAYAEQYAEAHRLLDALVRSEPYDSGVHNAAAWLAEWRGLPRSAQQQFEYVLAVDPANADAHAGLAAARTATGDIAGARNALEHAEQVDPAHPGAVDARLKYRLATAASVAAAAEHRQDFRARQTLTGLRAATPLVSDHWRLTAGIDWLEGRLDGGGQVSDRWPMVGLQWLARDVSAQLAAQRYRYADRTGVAASVEWSVDDHWRVRAGAASAARDVPLQAIAAGIHARQASIGASWRRDEGRLLSLDARRQAFSDGNRRNEVSAAWSERLREWTDARLSVNALLHSMTNTIDAAPYFNPRRGLTGSAELLYEHAGWRLLDRWLWHELGVTVGAFDQSGFRTTSIGALRYGLRWRPDTWTDIRLGYLLTRRAYDGEYGTYHQATLSVLRRF